MIFISAHGTSIYISDIKNISYEREKEEGKKRASKKYAICGNREEETRIKFLFCVFDTAYRRVEERIEKTAHGTLSSYLYNK